MKEKSKIEKNAEERQISLLSTALGEASKANGYWLNVMDEYNETGVDLYTTHRAAIESLTPAKIVAFLKKVVASNNHIQVVMLPEL